MGNMGELEDCFIEENFSYIRVFGCSIPPHALSRFLIDRLVCQEVAYQTVTRGINKEMKESQKKSMNYLPYPGWYVFTIGFRSPQSGGCNFGIFQIG
jgi:hypothetical protein